LKGAVTTVLPLCKNPKDELSAVEEKVESLATKGYRAIAVPKGATQDHMKLLGIAFLYDKVRPDSLNLIEELRDLGIKVKMLTGDALPIVKEVAEQLHLGGNIIRISDLKGNPEEKNLNLIEKSDGFAEIYPEEKFLIIKNLQIWNSRPSRFLLLAVAADLVVVFFISILGLPGIVPISPRAALAVVGFSFVIVFLINDPLKVMLIRKLRQR